MRSFAHIMYLRQDRNMHMSHVTVVIAFTDVELENVAVGMH